jgi:hypothetical protein
MSEVGLARRIAPAILIAVAGVILLRLRPSGADVDTSSSEDLGAPEPSSGSTAPAAGGSTGADGSPGGSSASGPRTIKGDVVNFRYGTLQVKVVLDGTTITDIKTITAPGGGYQSWTDRAIPTMKSEILSAQSTRVAAASGATYTSKAYAQSVQSALDRA